MAPTGITAYLALRRSLNVLGELNNTSRIPDGRSPLVGKMQDGVYKLYVKYTGPKKKPLLLAAFFIIF